MKDTDELFDKYIAENFRGNFRMEGCTGVRNMEKLCEDLGYNEGEFIGRHPLMNFLADNPGAIEALYEFIAQALPHVTDWQEALDLESYDGENEDIEEDEEL